MKPSDYVRIRWKDDQATNMVANRLSCFGMIKSGPEWDGNGRPYFRVQLHTIVGEFGLYPEDLTIISAEEYWIGKLMES